MPTFTAYDVRVSDLHLPQIGALNPDDRYYAVRADTGLVIVVEDIVRWAEALTSSDSNLLVSTRTLRIIAHGRQAGCDLGYGIIFGRNDISLKSVEKFRPLRGRIDKIEMRVCGAAASGLDASYNNSGLWDNNRTCRRLAQIVNCEVLSSPNFQSFDFRNGMDVWYGALVSYRAGDGERRVVGNYAPTLNTCIPRH